MTQDFWGLSLSGTVIYFVLILLKLSLIYCMNKACINSIIIARQKIYPLLLTLFSGKQETNSLTHSFWAYLVYDCLKLVLAHSNQTAIVVNGFSQCAISPNRFSQFRPFWHPASTVFARCHLPRAICSVAASLAALSISSHSSGPILIDSTGVAMDLWFFACLLFANILWQYLLRASSLPLSHMIPDVEAVICSKTRQTFVSDSLQVLRLK